MSFETFETIIRKGVDYGIERIRFCGLGEPLLHEDFRHFFSHVKKHTHWITELITNGSLLDKAMVHWLIEHRIDFLSISFPSLVRENYEQIMKRLVFNDVLERVTYAVHELKKASATHIKITGVVTDINGDEKEALMRYWSQSGVDGIELYMPHNRGGYLKDNDALMIASPSEHGPGSGNQRSLCPWPLRQFFIAWDGAVLLCCCDMEGDFSVGNIYRDDLSEMERIQESICISQPALCRRCSYQRAKIIMKKDA